MCATRMSVCVWVHSAPAGSCVQLKLDGSSSTITLDRPLQEGSLCVSSVDVCIFVSFCLSVIEGKTFKALSPSYVSLYLKITSYICCTLFNFKANKHVKAHTKSGYLCYLRLCLLCVILSACWCMMLPEHSGWIKSQYKTKWTEINQMSRKDQ